MWVGFLVACILLDVIVAGGYLTLLARTPVEDYKDTYARWMAEERAEEIRAKQWKAEWDASVARDREMYTNLEDGTK